MAYTKLANAILTSTIWMEDDHTRLVWLTMLAMADKNGEVQASIPGLANIARVPVESCREAIAKFLSPDPDSRTKDDEGRRVEEIRGGWLLINHGYYRELASGADRASKGAERQRRFRAKTQRNATVTPTSRNSNATVTPPCQADTDTDTDTDTDPSVLLKKEPKGKPSSKDEVLAYAAEQKIPEIEALLFWDMGEAGGWMRGKVKVKDWKAHFRVYSGRGWLTPKPSINGSTPREPMKSFAQQDQERKQAERHGPEIIKPKILFTYTP